MVEKVKMLGNNQYKLQNLRAALTKYKKAIKYIHHAYKSSEFSDDDINDNVEDETNSIIKSKKSLDAVLLPCLLNRYLSWFLLTISTLHITVLRS